MASIPLDLQYGLYIISFTPLHLLNWIYTRPPLHLHACLYTTALSASRNGPFFPFSVLMGAHFKCPLWITWSQVFFSSFNYSNVAKKSTPLGPLSVPKFAFCFISFPFCANCSLPGQRPVYTHPVG